MRIAFVGKGGSGKSTLTASFATYLSHTTALPVVVFDADLNIHAPELLGFETIPSDKHLSDPQVSETIKKWLIGTNEIKNLGAFRKTTPPTRKSNIIKIKSINDTPIGTFGAHRNNLSVFAVGTYQDEDIGASCYHNNLAIFESILNHTDDANGYLIADMVAGVDSFAGTLHAQFDLTCLIVEPTKRSIEVYEKYKSLAREAGVHDSLVVIVNKVRSQADKEFVSKHIDDQIILGYFSDDAHIRHIDQTATQIDIEKLSDENMDMLKGIKHKIDTLPDSRNHRLTRIWDLHKKYVAQAFIRDRFGDLTSQIDSEFTFDK